MLGVIVERRPSVLLHQELEDVPLLGGQLREHSPFDAARRSIGGKLISIDRAPDWVKKLQGDLKKAAMRGLYSAAQRGVEIMQTEIIPAEPRVPVDRGIFKAGFRVKKIAKGFLIFNRAPHAVVVDQGVRAQNVKIGRAMIDALAKWVIRKGLTGNARGAEKSAQGRNIAWAIAKSMQRRGIFNQGKGLMLMAKLRKRLPAVIEEEVRREIREMKKE